jgi:hypothetical protein
MSKVVDQAARELKILKKGLLNMTAGDLMKLLFESFEAVKIEIGYPDDKFDYNQVNPVSKRIMVRTIQNVLENLDVVFNRAEQRVEP